MDKFYNLQTHAVEELMPGEIPFALGLGPKLNSDGTVSTPVEATYAPVKGVKYEFFSPDAKKYTANSGQDYVSALRDGALPWNPIMEDANAYRQELKNNPVEYAKAVAYKAANPFLFSLPEVGTRAYQAYQAKIGDNADAYATELKRRILDEETGNAGKVAEFIGLMGSPLNKVVSKVGTKALGKIATNEIGKKLESTILGRVATRAAVSGAEMGAYTGIEKGIAALVPQSEDEFDNVNRYAESVVARLSDVPGEMLESGKAGALLGGVAKAVPEVAVGVAKRVSPLWTAVTDLVNSKSSSVGDFADALGAGQMIPRGSKADAAADRVGQKNFDENVEFLRQNWDKKDLAAPGKAIFDRWLQSANETYNNIKGALKTANEKMNAFVKSLDKEPVFDIDDVFAKSQSELQKSFGPRASWRPNREQAIADRVVEIIRNEIPRGFPRQTGSSMFGPQTRTLGEMRTIKNTVSDRAMWNKRAEQLSVDEEAYRIVDGAMKDSILSTLDDIGKRLPKSGISGKKYEDLLRAQSALKMAEETVTSKRNSLFAHAPAVIGGATSALIVQGILGNDLLSPQTLFAGIVGGALSQAYGRNVVARGLKSISDIGLATDGYINKQAERFSKITPKEVRDRGATAVTILGSNEVADAFGFKKPDSNEKYMNSINARLSQIVSNPEAAAEMLTSVLGDLTNITPQTSAAIQQTIMRGATYAKSQLPQPQDMTAIGQSEYHVSDDQVSRFNQKLTGVLSPKLVINNMVNGTATQDQIEGFKATYPELYSQIQSSFGQAAATAPRVNALTKQSLGVVLDKPITAPMQKQYLKYLQDNYSKQDGPGRPKSTSNMGNVGQMYQTEASRVANRNLGN